MIARRTTRALAEVLRIGFKEAVAYRAELFVWVLATTMPLVMLVLFAAVAHDAPVGRYGEVDFIAYFLATFLVRQLTGSWAAWQISIDIREGNLATKLLRPIHPLLVYGLEGLASIPLRLALAMPVATVAIIWFAGDRLTRDPGMWLVWAISVFGAWLITLFINFAVGCLAFFIDSSSRVMDVYLALYFVGSGYLVPIDLFPAPLQRVVDVLPFRYQIGLPVELMTNRYTSIGQVLPSLAAQWAWVAVTFLSVILAWRSGIRRFGAFGG